MGFIDSVQESMKNHWFYRLGEKIYQKNSGFL